MAPRAQTIRVALATRRGKCVITVQREDPLMVLHELVPIFQQQQAETGNLRQLPFQFNWPLVNQLSISGAFIFFIARDEGKIIGYNIFCVTRTTQHAAHVIAINELLYLKPEYRKGISTIIELMSVAERELMKLGVSAVRYHSVPTFKASKGGLGKLYKFMGAKPLEVTYEKVLTPETAGRRKRYGRRRNRDKRTTEPLHAAERGHGVERGTRLQSAPELRTGGKRSVHVATVQPAAKPH